MLLLKAWGGGWGVEEEECVVEVKCVWRGGRVERSGLGGAVVVGGEGEKGEPAVVGLAGGGEVMERMGLVGWMEVEGVGCCCCCCCCWKRG